MITVLDTNQSNDLNAEEWCAAWEAVVNGNSQLPEKDDGPPAGQCEHNNKDADGNEIFDADGSPWGCSWYATNTYACGNYDSDTFQASMMCCECGGGCADGKQIIGSQVTDEVCPETCVFSDEGCGTGPNPPTPQWETDFGMCDVTKDVNGIKEPGQDDVLCPTEITDCFTSLCGMYICSSTTSEPCNCEHYDIS